MGLHTGRRFHSRTWQRLPITADVITAVDKLARDQHQPCMNDGPIFEWGPNMPINDDVVDDEYSSDNDDVSVSPVPIVPLLLPQPFLNADSASTNSADSTTDDDVTLDDNDSIAPADIARHPAQAPAELPLDFVAPDDDVLIDDAPTDTDDALLDDADDQGVTD